jgi:hypothetical protein
MLMLSNCSCLIGGFGALFDRYLYVDMLEEGYCYSSWFMAHLFLAFFS